MKKTPQKFTVNFDELDGRDIYSILSNAKELMRYLNDKYKDFPIDTYINGTEYLKFTMNYVDDMIIREED